VRLARARLGLLAALAATIPVSIFAAEMLLTLALVVLALQVWKRQARLPRTPLDGPAASTRRNACPSSSAVITRSCGARTTKAHPPTHTVSPSTSGRPPDASSTARTTSTGSPRSRIRLPTASGSSNRSAKSRAGASMTDLPSE